MRALIILLFAVLVMPGCLCSSGCRGADPIEIVFDGYANSDIDSILVQTYVAGTSLSSALNQNYTLAYKDATDGELKINFSVEENIDYRIILLPDSNQFTLTNIKFLESQKKKRGFCLGYTKEAVICPLVEATSNGNKVTQRSNSSYTLTK